jgi:hypothetical protein
MAAMSAILTAHHVVIALCDSCPAVHIDLCHADGTIFATASCGPEEAWIESFIAELRKQGEIARRRAGGGSALETVKLQ